MQGLTIDNLSHLSPFSGMEAESLAQVQSLAHLETYPRSARSVDFDWTHKVTYLIKGELKVDYPDGRMKVLVGGHAESMSPLIRNRVTPRAMRPITDISLVWFDENALDILLTWDQLVPGNQGDMADWRSMSGIFDARQLSLGTFSCLPPAHIESLLSCFKRQRVAAGEVIIQQGDPGDCYYVIERGRARVTRDIAGARMKLADIKAGDAFGEEALISETVRNATVTMETDGELLRLEGADFIRLLKEPLLQKIDAATALRHAQEGARWLDVRFPAEYQHDGLPGATNIPLNELRNALPNLDPAPEYIVYCQTGRRSSAAAFLLSQRGFRAFLLDGGLKAMAIPEKLTP